MAQFLKDEIKNNIINAAKKEFLEKGFDKGSMRNIATNAGITVGNIYRYVENKEALFTEVVSPIFDELNAVLKRETNNSFQLFTNPQNIMISKDGNEDNLRVVNSFASTLADIFEENKDEMLIILSGSGSFKYGEEKQDFNEWIVNVFASSLKFLHGIEETKETQIESIILASGFLASLVTAFDKCVEKQKLERIIEKLIKFYFFNRW